MTEPAPTARFILPDGHEIPIEATLTLGRSVSNAVKLDGDAVSRQHAVLEVNGSRYTLRDLSSNGTFVNDRRLTGAVELNDGDRVRIGPNTLTFRKPKAAPSATVVWQTTEPLTLVRGDGAEFGLNRSLKIGRAADNDLQLVNDESGSQNHAKIDLVAGQAIVTDLSSKNGTWVNGKRISGPTRLKHGDKVTIGDTIFRLRVGTQPFVDAGQASRPAAAMGVGLFVGGGLLTLLVVGVVVAGLAALGGVWYFFLRPTEPAPTVIVQATSAVAPVSAATQQAEAEQTALRALVFVISPVGNPNTTNEASSGSGSLLNEQGFVLTNFHVVGDPDTGRVYNPEGWAMIGINWNNPADAPDTFYRAEIAQNDHRLDLAVLHIVATERGDPLPADLVFPYIPVGDSDALKIGDPIAVLGFPGLGGDTPTLTRGSVSGFLLDDFNNIDKGWIKTDAEINPGNSGGMAINAQGELIGVPTQAYTGTDVTGKISEIRPINIALQFLQVQR